MLRWPNSYYNAFVGESGTTGLLFIGKDSAAHFGSDRARLAINIGGTSGVYSYVKDFAAGFQAGKILGIVPPLSSPAGSTRRNRERR